MVDDKLIIKISKDSDGSIFADIPKLGLYANASNIREVLEDMAAEVFNLYQDLLEIKDENLGKEMLEHKNLLKNLWKPVKTINTKLF